MKRLVIALALIITASVSIISCTASKASSRNGCKNTQNMIGYR